MFKWSRRDSRGQSHISDELLSAYLDNEITAQERRQVTAHLATCASCRENLQSLRAAVALVRALPRVPVPRAFTLTEAIVGARPRKARSPWIVTYLRGATVVAAMMLVVLVGGDLFLRSAQQTPQMVALQSPVETRLVEKVVKETVVVAPTVVTEETRPVEASQPVTAPVAVPEATQPVQQKVVEKAAPEAEKAVEETPVEQLKTAEAASPAPEPVREFPRGGGGAGGVGGIGGAGGPGGEGGGATSSDLGPGVEPVPTEAPPQPDKAVAEKAVKEAPETAEPTVRSAQAVEATPTAAEKVVEKAVTPTSEAEKEPQITVTPSPTLEVEKTPQVDPTPTPTVTPPATATPIPAPSVQPSPTAAPTETPAAVALASVEPTPESIAMLPAQASEQTRPTASQPFAWAVPLRIAEFSLGVLIVLLLAASWIAARRA